MGRSLAWLMASGVMVEIMICAAHLFFIYSSFVNHKLSCFVCRPKSPYLHRSSIHLKRPIYTSLVSRCTMEPSVQLIRPSPHAYSSQVPFYRSITQTSWHKPSSPSPSSLPFASEQPDSSSRSPHRRERATWLASGRHRLPRHLFARPEPTPCRVKQTQRESRGARSVSMMAHLAAL